MIDLVGNAEDRFSRPVAHILISSGVKMLITGVKSCQATLCTFQPPRGKTNNMVSEQVRHKPGCTVTEDS